MGTVLQRLHLIRHVSELPQQQFNQLAFALNPPAGQLPGCMAPVADRAYALLTWAESPIGYGLKIVEDVLVDLGASKKNLNLTAMTV